MQVAKGVPTAVTIASKDDEVASRVQDLLSTHRFRCYRTTDVQGVHSSHLNWCPIQPSELPDLLQLGISWFWAAWYEPRT